MKRMSLGLAVTIVITCAAPAAAQRYAATKNGDGVELADTTEHDPDYDGLRDDPRFQRLLQNLK